MPNIRYKRLGHAEDQVGLVHTKGQVELDGTKGRPKLEVEEDDPSRRMSWASSGQRSRQLDDGSIQTIVQVR